MEVSKTNLEDAFLIKPKVFGDERGFFYESYNKKSYDAAGVVYDFKQDNHSRSQKNILRGLHLQIAKPQAKLVRVTRGAVLDVIVDLRPKSNSYKKWQAFNLSEENRLQLLVPRGFAHGFYVLEDGTEFQYKCNEFYYPEDEITLAWDDESLGITWPDAKAQLSDKDSCGLKLSEVLDRTAESYSAL
jgi:dTDP-4-dehydrorhamnose 3,5-epimerase